MNWSDLTVEALRKERPDLVKELFTPSPTEQLEAENKKLTDTIAERDKKITEYELKEANREKEAKEQQHAALVSRLLSEAKIPDKVKYEEKEGKKVCKPHFLNLMTRCESEEEMKGLVADWEKAFAQTRTPISEAKELNFGVQPVSGDKVDSLFHALTH